MKKERKKERESGALSRASSHSFLQPIGTQSYVVIARVHSPGAGAYDSAGF